MTDTVVYCAKKIITMNPSRPVVTHVAVRDRRILSAGSLEEMQAWGDFRLDETFKDKTLMPGFIEGHCHIMEGALWQFSYVGFHDRMDPEGKIWPGAKDLDTVIDQLSAAEKAMPDDSPLVAWGLDPIYFDNRRCVRADLDRVSASRVIVIMHASGHIVNTNSAGLESVEWLREGIDHPGIPLGEDGLPTGELKGPESMMPVMSKTPLNRSFLNADHEGLIRFGKLCVRSGVTTATDLASPLTESEVSTMKDVTGQVDYPARIVPLLRMMADSPKTTMARAVAARPQSDDKLRLGGVKIIVDGSIQGFSARVRWPGYFNGAPNGLWYTAPEQIKEALSIALRDDVVVHLHTNGDEATELVLDIMTELSREQTWADHRFTLQHCQLADEAQFRRIKALGLNVNLFANHVYYWGDEHYSKTVGPERAERMNACATAKRNGVNFAIHSDAPITPLAPLFTAWCAVNRMTSSGRVLGREQRISVEDALYAITLGAARTLKLDAEIGSIESGKQADFAVLESDPAEVPPEQLRDIPIWGTVIGGDFNPVPRG